jgi:hypothetical protein
VNAYDNNRHKKELVIFVAIITVVGIFAIVAFQIAGPMGIEERFQNLRGISHNAGDVLNDNGVSVFSLEGQPLLYTVVLCVLVIICIIAFRQFSL